ncbi:MAG: ABC transporter permease, partial [Planctomycetes bacterium]|nr:ABC transporter permease [Planctomycetota bacterium]
MDLSAKKKLRQRNALLLVSKFGTIIGLFIMLLSFSIAVPQIFHKARNLVNIVHQASLSAIISGG